MEQFTPGEWHLEADYIITKTSIEGNVICQAPEIGCEESLKFWPANAALIAAAPELLQSCQEMLKHILETDFDVCGTPETLIEKWERIIKKATD